MGQFEDEYMCPYFLPPKILKHRYELARNGANDRIIIYIDEDLVFDAQTLQEALNYILEKEASE